MKHEVDIAWNLNFTPEAAAKYPGLNSSFKTTREVPMPQPGDFISFGTDPDAILQIGPRHFHWERFDKLVIALELRLPDK